MRTFCFLGVTTGGSLIMRIFPRWAEHLGLQDVRIAGTDLPIHADPAVYRARVERLKADDRELGALVTTHKIDLFAACRDLFDEIDEHAELCGETSCLAKRDGRLRALAKDPISAGQSLDAMLTPGHFERTGAGVLCLGAGGAAIAIAIHLLGGRGVADRPERLVIVDRRRSRLDALAAIVRRVDPTAPVDYIHNEDPAVNDELLHGLAPGSLVVNATGMGKDTPGSPITDGAGFPERAVAWELNYRGELGFLHQARAQEEGRAVQVHDGWLYFIHGWTAVIEEVFDVRFTGRDIAELSAIAGEVRAEGAAA